MKEIKQIIQAFYQAASKGREAVLATVVHIEGSSYRAPGARMLITDEGELTGAISGGCLESDILRKALMVMQTGRPLLVTYDTSDEDNALFAVNLGCNGIISILLENIEENDSYNPIAILDIAVKKRQNAIVVTLFTKEDKSDGNQGTKLLYTPTQLLSSDSCLPGLARMLEADMHSTWENEASAFIRLPFTAVDAPQMTAMLEFLPPSISLVIAGAGNDVLPLVAMAEMLGWDVTIMDGRPLYANESRFPSCQVMLADPEKAISALEIKENTAIVLMSHNYTYDKAVLRHALLSPSNYIGLLGPSQKRDKLLDELRAAGLNMNAQLLEKLHAPVGLNLGSETSEEIALAVIAEIQAVFAGTDGHSMKQLKGKIHQRNTMVVSSIKSYGIMVLAAGASKRMGSPKQTIAYKGETLLSHAARQALQLQPAVTLVVIPADHPAIREDIQGLDVKIVENADFREGMSSSIKTGLEVIKADYPQLEYVLIMLCDQPFVNEKHLRNLIATQRETQASVTASQYEGIKGVPALFHQSLFDRLINLEGDTGAKHLIQQLGNEVASVAFPLAAFDVDTPHAKNQLYQSEQS